MDEDAYVVGLLLALIVLAAVPMFATGVTWFGVLLLIMVWSGVIAKKGSV